MKYKVIIKAGRIERNLYYCDTIEEAEEFCNYYEWEFVDENGFPWDMEIREN